MPKIRTIKTQAEAEKVPVTEPITVIVPDEDVQVSPVELSPQPTSTPVETVETKQDETPSLTKHVDHVKKLEETHKQQLDAEIRARNEAELRRTAEARKSQQEIIDAKLDATLNAISAIQADADTAKQQYTQAMQMQDYAAAAEAQSIMNKADIRLDRLEVEREDWNNKKEELSKQPEPAAPLTGLPLVEAFIGQNETILMPGEKEWLRKHPEAISSNGNARRMEQAFQDAGEWGIERGSPEYFQFFNDRLGIKEKIDAPEAEEAEAFVEEEPVAAPETSHRRVSAPPSRASVSPGGTRQQSTSRVELTTAQREAARWSGVDESEYAKGLMRLNALKRDGFYSDN